MTRWIVSSSETGMKLIDFIKLKLNDNTSARRIKKLIEGKSCKVNGRIERFASKGLGTGDEVIFEPIEPKSVAYRILYEDADLLAIDKPPGVASESPIFKKQNPALELIHRLDKETSGVLMFAKSAIFKEAMVQEFKKKQVEKNYVAIVAGVPANKRGSIENYLGKIAQFEGQSMWGIVKAEEGKHAKTDWELIKRGKESALLACKPFTGRTHQIRVHLSNIGHPILGDHVYGRKTKLLHTPPRCCLHARSVTFAHPKTGKQIFIEAPIPQDMQSLIEEMSL